MHDIHTHLYWDSYDKDRDAVIARAHVAGIESIFAIGCTVEESQQCALLAEKYSEIFASVGIHPHEFNEQQTWSKEQLSESIQELKKLAQESKKVVAIGECGLDYYSHDKQKTINSEQKKLQKEGFMAQIGLAKELSLPLIVHCRPSEAGADVYEDMLAILKTQGTDIPAIILHCYMGDTEVTKHFLELPNVHFSFTANITYPVKKALAQTKDDLTETVKLVPIERLFVETDCPFLAPQSKRGERNEPAYVAIVVETVAEIKGIDAAMIRSSIDERVSKVFVGVSK
jgi:TatD DNase family protein